MKSTYILIGHLTANQPLATCSKDLKDEAERRFGKNYPTPVPSVPGKLGQHLMFPSTGIRGKFRRSLRDVFREKLIELTGNPKPFTLDQHYMLTLGGVKDDSDSDKATIAMEAEYREKNPLISMFGAGAAGNLGFVTGRLQVSNAICVEAAEPIRFTGARTDDLYRDTDQINYLTDDDVQSLIQRAEGNRDASKIRGEIRQAETKVKALKKKGSAEELVVANGILEALKAKLDKVLDDSGASSVSVGMPLSGWQAIAAGSVMDHQMTLTQGTQVELGALMAMLEQFSLNPILGAHYANGCGEVKGSWDVYRAARGGKQLLGSISFEPYEGVVSIEAAPGSELYQAKEAFESMLSEGRFDMSIPGEA